MAAARVGRRRRAPVAGDNGERAAELPFTPTHLTAVRKGGGDGGEGCAARLNDDR
jgi:hypothetical protein